MKFSHNIPHTYSFILGVIKHNWKIRRFWVADPLIKLLLYKKFKFICYYIILKGKIVPVIYLIQHWPDEKHELKKVCTMNTKC